MAAEGGHKEIVECLVDEGADINIKNNDGVKQLHSQASPVLCSSVCVQYNTWKWKSGSSASVYYTS